MANLKYKTLEFCQFVDGPADLSLRGPFKSSDVSSDSDCSESLHDDDEVDVMSDDTWNNEPKT